MTATRRRRLPRTRAECVNAARPCPHSRCRHHLAASPTDSCVLDVVDREGALSGEDVAPHLGVTQQMVHVIETRAMVRLLRAARLAGLTREDAR